jgi:hypothetical protein
MTIVKMTWKNLSNIGSISLTFIDAVKNGRKLDKSHPEL